MEEGRIDIDEVRKYLLHQLSDTEMSSIDKKLLEDPAFKKEFTLYKTMVVAMEEHFDETLKDSLKREERKRPARQRQLLIFLSTAAAVLLISVLSYSIFYLAKPTPQQLFAEYYKPYYNVVDDHKRDNTISNEATEAFRLYDQKEYKKAAEVFDRELVDSPHNPALLFYSGLSQLVIDRPGPAIEKLKEVAGNSSQFTEAAQWYLALAYLKNNDIIQSRKVLEKIASSAGAYRQKATILLEEIN